MFLAWYILGDWKTVKRYFNVSKMPISLTNQIFFNAFPVLCFNQRCIEERTCIQKSGVFLVVIFWPRKSLLMCLGLCRTSEWWFFGPVQYRTAPPQLHCAVPHRRTVRKWAKNKYVSKCLELSNSSRNAIKNFCLNVTRARARTYARARRAKKCARS